MDPYISFLSNGSLPNDSKESEKIKRTSSHFWLSEANKLYQHSFGGPYLLCLHPDKVTELLAKLHEGICEGHSRGRSLAHHDTGFLVAEHAKKGVEYVKSVASV